MKDSLLNLQRGIGLRDYSSEAEEKRSRYHWHTTTRPWGHAVQYRTCCVCEPVCKQQQDRAREDRGGRRDQQWAGPMDTKRGTVVSRAQRLKPPRGGNHGQKVPLSHTGTEVSPTLLRHCGKVRDLLPLHTCGTTFPSTLSCPIASYCKPCRPGSGREKEGKLLHAFRQPSSPQSVLTWSSSSLCVSKKKKKEEQTTRRDRVKERGVLSSLNGFLHSLDCSKPIVP